MNPKEKAKELIDKYIEIMPTISIQTGNTITNHAKQCSTILVEEIISQGGTNTLGNGSNYWKEVKKEIQNL